jgi:hypothetical protein
MSDFRNGLQKLASSERVVQYMASVPEMCYSNASAMVSTAHMKYLTPDGHFMYYNPAVSRRDFPRNGMMCCRDRDRSRRQSMCFSDDGQSKEVLCWEIAMDRLDSTSKNTMIAVIDNGMQSTPAAELGETLIMHLRNLLNRLSKTM